MRHMKLTRTAAKIKNSQTRRNLLVWLAAGALAFLTFSGVVAQTPANEAEPSLGGILDPKGRVKPGTTGSYDASNFHMETDKNGAPIFVPNDDAAAPAAGTCGAGWEHQFT